MLLQREKRIRRFQNTVHLDEPSFFQKVILAVFIPVRLRNSRLTNRTRRYFRVSAFPEWAIGRFPLCITENGILTRRLFNSIVIRHKI